MEHQDTPDAGGQIIRLVAGIVSYDCGEKLPEHMRLSENLFGVVFEQPSNKGNLGTMICSCEAFGVDTLLLTGYDVDMYDPEVITATMESFFRLQIMWVAENEGSCATSFNVSCAASVMMYELMRQRREKG